MVTVVNLFLSFRAYCWVGTVHYLAQMFDIKGRLTRNMFTRNSSHMKTLKMKKGVGMALAEKVMKQGIEM